MVAVGVGGWGLGVGGWRLEAGSGRREAGRGMWGGACLAERSEASCSGEVLRFAQDDRTARGRRCAASAGACLAERERSIFFGGDLCAGEAKPFVSCETICMGEAKHLIRARSFASLRTTGRREAGGGTWEARSGTGFVLLSASEASRSAETSAPAKRSPSSRVRPSVWAKRSISFGRGPSLRSGRQHSEKWEVGSGTWEARSGTGLVLLSASEASCSAETSAPAKRSPSSRVRPLSGRARANHPARSFASLRTTGSCGAAGATISVMMVRGAQCFTWNIAVQEEWSWRGCG